jgi:hypothetical protein
MTLLICFLLAGPATQQSIQRAIRLANDSGRVLLLGESDAARLAREARVPPGMPPVLTFRYLEGAARHRFGDLDLMVDDAGH